MSQQQPPDAVFLIHGTFAHRDEDVYEPDPHDPDRGPAWWQRNGAFVAGLNELFAGHAECWPDDVCKAMPWARPSIGSRLEGWTIFGMKPLGWLRPKYRIGSRRLFAWSGLNSESQRRSAGRRLFQGLQELERENAARIAAGEAPRSYHLIGHSHGGSVIWNALRIAGGRKAPLPHLRSWTTLGTPFPTYRPVRFQGLIGLLGLAMIAGVGWLELRGEFARVPRPIEWGEVGFTLQALFDWRSPANLFPLGISPATIAFLAILLVVASGFALAIITWMFRSLESWLDRRASDEAWRDFGGRWLGLFSELDEAIAGTQNTVGLYASELVRLPWTGPLPLPRSWNPLELLLALPIRIVFWLVSWVAVPLINGVALPMAEWVISLVFRLKFQGSDRLGSYLTLTSPEPFSRASFPDGPSRGPLPPALASPLHEHARTNVDARMFEVRSRFAADARSPRTPRELLRAYFANLKITAELIHNAYYDVEVLRRAIAYHILKAAAYPRLNDLLFPAKEGRDWLDGGAPVAADLNYLPRHKPLNTTPIWTRFLLASALGGLGLAAFHGLRDDIHGVYIGHLVDHITARPLREDHDRWLHRAFEVFRPYSEVRLVKLITQGEIEARQRGLDFLREFAEEGQEGRFASLPSSKPVSLEQGTIDSLIRLAFDVDSDRRLRIASLRTLMTITDRGLVADRIVLGCLAPQIAHPRQSPEQLESVRLGAWLVIRHLGPEVVPGIARILQSPDPSEVRAAAEALGAIGGPGAAPAAEDLIRKLLDGRSDRSVHVAAAGALRAIGVRADHRLVEQMVVDLDDAKDHSLRALAARTLATIGEPATDRAVVERLMTALEDRNPDVHDAAADALSRMGPLAIKPLIAALHGKSTRLAAKALEAIAAREGERVLEPFVNALGLRRQPHVRVVAVRAMGAMGEPVASRVVGHLDKALDDKNPAVIRAAAAALGKMGPRAVGPLVEFLRKHPSYRVEAVRALGAIGAPGADQALEPLVGALGDEHPAVRHAAADALGSIGELAAHRAVEPLIKALAAPNKAVRSAAVHALGRMGPRAVGPLVDLYKDSSHRVESARALAAIGAPSAPRAVEPLIKSLKEKTEGKFIRASAAKALGAIGAPAAHQAVQPLIDAFGDKEASVDEEALNEEETPGDSESSGIEADDYPMVRVAAADALGAIGAPAAHRAAEPLLKALADEREHPVVRAAAARALGAFHAPAAHRAVGALVKALADGEIRKAAVSALGRIKDLPQEAKVSLIEALNRGDDDTRAAVAAVLANIGAAAEAAEAPLIDLVIVGDRHARQQAVQALEAIGFMSRPSPQTH